ncbi:MAG: transglutaminase-like domain-containing protein [Eubacteriales bacterium]|nr:transglutaminase-like domain-containing protein [Eubacteriales bacterium]MDD4461710.1 transglutaminase-like domain-containing protein [Eubacteriales bacterium]
MWQQHETDRPFFMNALCRHRLPVIAALLTTALLLSACQPVAVPSDSPSDTSLRPTPSSSQTTSTSAATAPETIPSDTTTVSDTTEPSTSPVSETSETTTDPTTATDTGPAGTTKSTTTEGTTTTAVATTTPKSTATPKPTATPAPTATPTPPPTATPSPTPKSSGAFPYKNYGTLFRDDYDTGSQVVQDSDSEIFIATGSTSRGVVLVRINSSAIAADKRARAILMDTAGTQLYTYDIVERDRYVGIPLNKGNGTFKLMIASHAPEFGANAYLPEMEHQFSVSLSSSLRPYTASSVKVNFSRGSAAAQQAASLTRNIETADGKVSAVYEWIVRNISYDRDLASKVSSGAITVYIAEPDRTMSTRKGICDDYAALMAAMLRSQGIPTRVYYGNVSLSTQTAYHAWNEVFFEGQGWVVVADFRWQNIDGSSWVHFDSTFAASGTSPETIQKTSYSKSRVY